MNKTDSHPFPREGKTYVRNGDTYVEVIGTNLIIGSMMSHKVKILDYETSDEAMKVFNGIKTLFCFEEIIPDSPKAGSNMVNY